MKTAIVWFRQDLRLADNPALLAASKNADVVLPVFIDDPTPQSCSSIGAASRAWLHYSLHSLDSSLRQKHSGLLLVQGPAEDCLSLLIQKTKATDVYWNRCYDPVSIARDTRIKSRLSEQCRIHSENGLLLSEPWQNCKDDGSPYRVFTPYWRKLAKTLPAPDPLPAPKLIPPPPATCTDELLASGFDQSLDQLGLLPDIAWHTDMLGHWKIGEKAAARQCRVFLDKLVDDYGELRNVPGYAGTSRLSPHLHFGEISPRQVAQAIFKAGRGSADVSRLSPGAETYLKEIVWREFAYHLLFHFPKTVDKPLDQRFENFPWPRLKPARLRAWQRGQTGVPIVDAGMRELWQTGWMHNRVRMIVASYLVKNLQIPWQKGENWFRDTLVDADIASNVMGWQWTAGCGADAAPYFRVFNPVLQGEKFDGDGDYVRRFVPELAALDNRNLHKPWELPTDSLRKLDYPDPLVDLKSSRAQALAAFDTIKAPVTK